MATETWTHGFATTNGIRLHYVEQGEGPLLLLLHGCWAFWYSWRHQIPVLAQRFHVVAPDLRGFNDSDKPEGVSVSAPPPGGRRARLTALLWPRANHFGRP